MDRDTGANSVRQRFLTAVTSTGRPRMGTNGLGRRSGGMLESTAVPGFRVLFLSRAEARERQVAQFHRARAPFAHDTGSSSESEKREG